jgi:hypothetical protein
VSGGTGLNIEKIDLGIMGIVSLAIGLMLVLVYFYAVSEKSNTLVLIDQVVLADIIIEIQENYYLVNLSQFKTQNEKE